MKADERRNETEEAKENEQQEIEEAKKKIKEEEEHSNHSHRNIVIMQIDRPDKVINNLLNDIIPRDDMDVSGSLGAKQKYEEVRSPQRKKKKKNKRKEKKIKKLEGRSRVNSSSMKLWKGKRRG